MCETVRFGQSGGRYFDALRPSVEPDGFASEAELIALRLDHLRRVRTIFERAEVFVFTLGLTEAWEDRATGTVFPSAPGVMGGEYDPDKHGFANFTMAETMEDLRAAIGLMRYWKPNLPIILTVSPVPLTATGSGAHVLQASTYSKAVLRAVAGEVADSDPHVDYFASYEIITGGPFAGQFFNDNLRTVTEDGVLAAMTTFFSAHSGLDPLEGAPVTLTSPEVSAPEEDELICEEALLEAFAGS